MDDIVWDDELCVMFLEGWLFGMERDDHLADCMYLVPRCVHYLAGAFSIGGAERRGGEVFNWVWVVVWFGVV